MQINMQDLMRMFSQPFNQQEFDEKFSHFRERFEEEVKKQQPNVEITYQQPLIQQFQSRNGSGQPIVDVVIWNPSTQTESTWCIGHGVDGYWFVNVRSL